MSDEARARLVGAARRLNIAVGRTAVAQQLMGAAADALDAWSARLGETHLPAVPRTSFEDAVGAVQYSWQSFNPAVPRMDMRFADDEVYARFDGGIGPLHEGPPGLLHGGAAALVLDVALSSLLQHKGIRSVTASLTVDYKAPTAIDEAFEVRGVVESAAGRKVWATGDILVAGAAHVSARGLFISIAQ